MLELLVVVVKAAGIAHKISQLKEGEKIEIDSIAGILELVSAIFSDEVTKKVNRLMADLASDIASENEKIAHNHLEIAKRLSSPDDIKNYLTSASANFEIAAGVYQTSLKRKKKKKVYEAIFNCFLKKTICLDIIYKLTKVEYNSNLERYKSSLSDILQSKVNFQKEPVPLNDLIASGQIPSSLPPNLFVIEKEVFGKKKDQVTYYDEFLKSFNQTIYSFYSYCWHEIHDNRGYDFDRYYYPDREIFNRTVKIFRSIDDIQSEERQFIDNLNTLFDSVPKWERRLVTSSRIDDRPPVSQMEFYSRLKPKPETVLDAIDIPKFSRQSNSP